MGQNHKKSGGVTIVDIAREVGVSHATVSRVLNGHEGVKPATRQRVLDAVERLGYVANLQARRLAGGRSHVIGLIVSGLTNGYTNQLLEGIEIAVSETDYDLLLYSSISRTRRRIHESSYVDRLINGLADGLLIISPFFPEAYIERLEQHNFPYVLVDHSDQRGNRPVIYATNHQGAREATEYLTQLGHRRIGFITGWQLHPSTSERLEGYKAALAAHGLVFDAALVRQGDFLTEGGYRAGLELLTLPDAPTAIFASSDDMAIGVMDAARQLHLRIPDDISIVGFDDIHQASLVYPKLTTVSQSLSQTGAAALNMLVDYIENPQSPRRQHAVATRLVIRDSCQPPAPSYPPSRQVAVHEPAQEQNV
jgi:LacI family transcriptional regulator